jgi:hypothetical protein
MCGWAKQDNFVDRRRQAACQKKRSLLRSGKLKLRFTGDT